ncbi:hypothetical protein AB0I49_36485 [Streptomyces sp. NPDC050617]|uniref:hypothetical protein n=1 Tax=Streptomyces sp. NPDC050617 TaxID=3154628 RepID=UPI00342F053B
MHCHGYLWVGEKATFDKEGIRRPPAAEEPTATSPSDVAQRYREAAAEWRTCDVPPIQVAHWLMKPSRLVRGTWEEPKEAAEWLGRQLVEFAPRFSSEEDRDSTRLTGRVAFAAETLAWGGDISHGHYLRRPQFLSLALVTCSPNRAAPQLNCPLRSSRP